MEPLMLQRNVTTLVDLTEETLLDYIKRENFRPGDKLSFDENQISEQLNVSRSVAREALSRLRSYGIIVSRKRKGMVIQEPDIQKNLSKIIEPNMLGRETILDLLQLRYIIEIGIIPFIFENITDKDIEDLRNTIPPEFLTGKTIRLTRDHEIQFHSRIYDIARNTSITKLQELLIPIYGYVLENYSEFDAFNKRIKKDNLQATHLDLIEALAKRDERLYKDTIERHLLAYKFFMRKERENI